MTEFDGFNDFATQRWAGEFDNHIKWLSGNNGEQPKPFVVTDSIIVPTGVSKAYPCENHVVPQLSGNLRQILIKQNGLAKMEPNNFWIAQLIVTATLAGNNSKPKIETSVHIGSVLYFRDFFPEFAKELWDIPLFAVLNITKGRNGGIEVGPFPAMK